MKFAVKAVGPASQVVALELEAGDEASARDLARERGLAVLTVAPAGFAFALPKGQRGFPTRLFSIELLALLEAGLNIVEALQTLAEKEQDRAHRAVLLGLLDSISRGESLSRAIARHPQIFSPLYVATIRSSEQTGDAREALARFIAYQEEIDVVRRKAVAALLYPAILLVVGALVVGFLLFYVVPRFASVYGALSGSMPVFSSLLLSAGQWLDSHAAAVLLFGLGAICAAAWVLTKDSSRAACQAMLWRLPGLGERLKVYQLARFYRTAAMLLRAGIPALKALDMVGGLLGSNLKPRLAAALDSIREGRSISSALTAAGLATPVATRMMAVGERSGRMAELMERTARFYDDETARFVDAFTRLLEPALMAALGLAVGAIVVLMYMPIFELAGSIQ